MEKKFIESVNFPFNEISAASSLEKGPGRPPHWEMVFWWTRKPLISTRAVIASCLLPENTDPTHFLHSIGIQRSKSKKSTKSPHTVNPLYTFHKTLLDPFSGFGSIPLEASRLALQPTAIELLPTAYLFLKSILEYPHYGPELIKDIEKWSTTIINNLNQDEKIKTLYNDASTSIGTWEVKCPTCKRWTPLVGNWWLARVKGKKGYKRLAWMEPEITNNKVSIKVVDLNKLLGNEALTRAHVDGLTIHVDNTTYRVPEKTVHARRETATCLLCSQPIKYIDIETKTHHPDKKNLPKDIKNVKWYVKYALEHSVTSPFSPEALARPFLLAKVKNENNISFEPCTDRDQYSLTLAEKEIETLLTDEDPDIPREPISPYSVRYLFPLLYGFTHWYTLFTSRQLLILIALVKLIRTAGTEIEKEKITQGFTPEQAFTYARIIVTYLSLALCKYADYNSLTTYWNPSLIRAPTMAVRGIAMNWNFTDTHPTARITGSFAQNIRNAIRGLTYLTSHSTTPCTVLLDDATMLTLDKTFDLIVTDPPYYDDVPYSELSDFYYVWLKRALSDVENHRLIPKYTPEAFFEKIGSENMEISTQWEKYALHEVSLNPPRLTMTSREEGKTHFQSLLNRAFITMGTKLKEDGLLVTYYAHTDPNAWKSLLQAGWEAANLKITNAFPLTTEPAQSVIKRGKLSMDTSIVVVWRKGSTGSIEASALYKTMVETAAKRATSLIEGGTVGRDLVINSLAACLAEATTYKEVTSMGSITAQELVDEYVYPAALLGIAQALSQKAKIAQGIKSPDAMFYLLIKFTLAGSQKKVIDTTDARLFSIGTSFAIRTAQTLNIFTKRKERSRLELTLLEPTSAEGPKFAEFLKMRGLSTVEPEIRCTVDALHVIEYFTLSSREEFKKKVDKLRVHSPCCVEEALSMAEIMAKVLPEREVERTLCERITEMI